MVADDKTKKIEKTQAIYNELLSKVSQLCQEAEKELAEMKA